MKSFFRNILLSLGFTLILLSSILIFRGLQNTWTEKWQVGFDWGGDLKQHYAAALTLKKSDYTTLYKDFHFGPILTDTFNNQTAAPIQKFNYRYCPLIAWISEKLLFLSYNTWLNTWLTTSILLYIAAFLLLKKFCPETSPTSALTATYFFAFPPFLYTLSIFQNSTLTFLIFVATAILLRKQKDFLSGLLLSCTFYKPQFAPYIGIFMLLAGRWKFFSGLAIGSILWATSSLLLCGLQSHLDYLSSLLETLRGIQDDEMATNIPWKGFILTVLPTPYQHPAQIFLWITTLILLIAIPLILRRHQKNNPYPTDYIFWISILFWMTFSPHVKSYEMILGMAWFLILAKQKHTLLPTLYWLTGLLAVTARFIGPSLAAPLLTLYLAASICLLLKYKYSELES